MSESIKSTPWEKVHIFVSSTFDDMHAERDYLVKQVFPRLSDWCEQRKLRMMDINLRWGVSEEDATRNSKVVNVCLSRIDDCRPFFLCFLGQRYGWVPRRENIASETFAPWLSPSTQIKPFKRKREDFLVPSVRCFTFVMSRT